MNRKYVRRGLIIVLASYWISMYVGTHLPRLPQAIAGQSDKLMHVGAYAGLAFLLALWNGSRGSLSMRRIGSLWLLVAGYGVFDEVTQPLFGRYAEFFDWTADIVGAAIGLGTGWLVADRARVWIRSRSATRELSIDAPDANGARHDIKLYDEGENEPCRIDKG